jgi:hypothetical protein
MSSFAALVMQNWIAERAILPVMHSYWAGTGEFASVSA